MNILFLSLNVSPRDKRDTITNSFIKKEMEHLYAIGHRVFYLSEMEHNLTEHGVIYLSQECLLEKNTSSRRINNLLFSIKHVLFFKFLLFKYFKQVLGVCGVERACVKAINKYAIDIIHTNFFEPSGESAVLASRICKVPICATLRGAELARMPEINYGACLNKFYATMIRKSVRRVDCFTAPSKLLCDKLESELSVPKNKIRYIPNGVEKIALKKDFDKKNEKVKFISIGLMIERKNFDIIFDAMEGIKGDIDSLEIFLVGSGPLRDKYEKLLKTTSLKNIYILDEMPKIDLFKLISTCDCLLHPSFYEGMTNVILESLAIGIPCLVSNIPQHLELIEDGVNGYLFDPCNRNELITKIKYILSNEQELGKMKNACIESVKKYSIESKIDNYVDIYNRLKKV